MVRGIAALAAVLFLSGVQSVQADWPQWLGPDRTGVSQETGFLKAWPQAGPGVVWKKNLGEGFSGISVANGRVFTMFAAGADEFVVCLNEESGAEIWRVRTGGASRSGRGATDRVHSRR